MSTEHPSQSTQSSQPSSSHTQTLTRPQSTSQHQPILILRGAAPESRHIQWAEDVVDNEGMGKKSSKVCCIYHRPRTAGDASSSDSSDSSDSDSDSTANDDGRARPMQSSNSRDRARGHQHRHQHRHEDGNDDDTHAAYDAHEAHHLHDAHEDEAHKAHSGHDENEDHQRSRQEGDDGENALQQIGDAEGDGNSEGVPDLRVHAHARAIAGRQMRGEPRRPSPNAYEKMPRFNKKKKAEDRVPED